MNNQDTVNFETLVADVLSPEHRAGQDNLALWSGRCDETALLASLKKWGLPSKHMPYTIWEYVSDIVFDTCSLPIETYVHVLQHGRIFGEHGDWMLWREGQEFAWRFVGQKETDACFKDTPQAQNFWKNEPDTWYHHKKNQQMMLWGKWSDTKGQWFDDRVARANLIYPVEGSPSRVLLEYDTFSRAGIVAFVWLKRLVAAK